MSSPGFPFDARAWNSHALLTCAEMRAAEAATYAKGVSSFSVMQRAGNAVAEAIRDQWRPCRTVVLCGPGNNGGDGYIVAENLRNAGWDVSVAAMVPREKLSGDAILAAKGYAGKTVPLEQVSYDDTGLVVVALFGTGLMRPIEGVAKAALEKLALTNAHVVAVDLPSGVNGNTGAVMGIAPSASLTVTFFRKKIGHCLMPGLSLCGDVRTANIGIGSDVLNEIKPRVAENGSSLWYEIFPHPKPGGHKYERGSVLIYGGPSMTGAARLGARAAQRMGAGLVTVATPQSSLPIYAEALESVIVHPADALKDWRDLLADPKRNAVLIGPGLGLGAAETDLVLAALETGKPCVLDADALSNFAGKPEGLLKKLNPQCVLTPHEGEFSRLFGTLVDKDADKLTRTREAAKRAGCVVLLKGSDTVIAAPDGYAVINTNAPPWLATAGAGDVLSGMILGLVAQNMPVFAATAAAAWLHGHVAASFGAGLIAEDLVSGIPDALRGLSDASGVV